MKRVSSNSFGRQRYFCMCRWYLHFVITLLILGLLAWCTHYLILDCIYERGYPILMVERFFYQLGQYFILIERTFISTLYNADSYGRHYYNQCIHKIIVLFQLDELCNCCHYFKDSSLSLKTYIQMCKITQGQGYLMSEVKGVSIQIITHNDFRTEQIDICDFLLIFTVPLIYA